MTKHIGIVACSAEGAALCYCTICTEGPNLLERYAHPEVTMHTFSLAEYMRYIEADDWENVASLMLASVAKIAKAGVDFAICPDNTCHQAFDYVVAKSPVPWLHIAEEVVNVAEMKGYDNLLILGTKYLMTGPVYKEIFMKNGIKYNIPDEDTRDHIDRIIFDELVYGIIKSDSKNFILQVIIDFKSRGCNAVVLGCTEIPLIVLPDGSGLPVLDSTRILARAAIREAVG